jgi:TrmH family RNA methyltransferase
MIKEISSLQNELVREVIQLQEKSRSRKLKRRFVIEGLREILLSLEGGFSLTHILYCEEIISLTEIEELIKIQTSSGTEIVKISLKVYQKLAHRKTTEGVVAIAKYKELNIRDLTLSEKPLILVAEAPEKPGNIGALLRTADAAHLDAVIIANPVTDLYNPNVIRSSVGCVFTTQIAVGSSEEALDFLKERGINIYTAVLAEDSKSYQFMDFKESSAIVVGTEATGLSEAWIENSSQHMMIPMQGKIDSLNVSVSAAILIFEAKRQREFKLPQ